MSNSTNLTVVHSNELIEASYNLTLDEMRLLSFAASKIDSRNKNVGELKIFASDFAKAFNLNKHNSHRNLINSVKALGNKSVIMPLDKEKNQVLPWLARGVYDKQSTDSSHVVIEFSKYIEPYIFELKERFTAVNFECAARLNTPFAFRLYQWLYKAKSLDKHKKGQGIEVILDINWMKKQACLEGLYDRWVNFRDRLILPSIEKINSETDISVDWQPIKTGRAVTALKFNYVLEKATQKKPLRPRLLKRPKVEKGSHQESEWMRANIKLLTTYRNKLLAYDKSLKLSLPDLRKLRSYHLALGEKDKAAFYKKEIDARTPAKKIKLEKTETPEEKLLRYAEELGVEVSLKKS